MADSFFGFGTEMPALGAGKTGEYDEGLLEPDDEIDMLNDETFGDGALFGEDWEQEHERMADKLESGTHLYDSQPESWMKQELRDSPPNELESSLNKLVKEDEQDTASRAQNIPGARAHARATVDLDNLFGPNSPSGLFTAEDMVAGHVNIWGSPSGQTPPMHTPKQQQEDGLKTLLKQMQQAKHPPGHISTSLPKAITLEQLESGMQGSRPVIPGGSAVPRALTVEELERQLTGEQPAPGRAQGIPMNTAMGNRVPSPPNTQMPIGTPPQRAALPQSMSGGMTNGSAHTVRPGMQSHSSHRPVPNQGFYPGRQRTMSGDGSPMAKSHMEMAGSPAQGHRMSGPHTPQQQRIPPGHAHTDPSHHRGHRGVHHQGPPHGPPSHLKQNLFQDRRGFDGPMNGSSSRHDQYMGRGEPGFGGPDHPPYGPPPPHRGGGGDYRHGPPRGGFAPNGRGYPPPGPRGPGYHGDDRGYYSYPRGGDRDGYYYPDRGRGVGPPPPPSYYDERDYRKRGGPGEHFRQRQMVGPAGDEDDDSRDIYAGLMSKKEKDWIIKIQLMQLQTENPYLDDYYYSMWQMKKLAEAREEESKRKDGTKGPSLVLPQLAGRVETKAYMPVQFDNSLGRLTAASVHNPRQIIDLRRGNSQDKEDQKGREVKRFKQLLLDVENAYDVLLVIVDMEKRADALPPEHRSQVYEDRRRYIHNLFTSLHLNVEHVDYFERLVTLRKGIKLVARLLPLLHQEDAIVVTRELLRYTADVMNKKGWSRDVLPQVLAQVSIIVNASPLQHLVQYCASLQGDRPSLQISTALQNQFGSSVIWCLMSRGEAIYKHESPLDLDVQDQKQWCSFVETVADCLAAGDGEMSLNKVDTQHASDITEHFRRLLDRGSFLSIEDKLSELCVPLARES